MHPRILLASTSRYRRQLLERLGLEFETCAVAVDESPHDGEAAGALATRLAQAKAAAAREHAAAGLAIGSDQVAELGSRLLGKPGDHAGAVAQLRALSGQTVAFWTAVCVRDLAVGRTADALVGTRVRFRTLDDAAIEHYLAREPAYDCAGSFKSEGLGITLVEAIDGDDPSALVGLPLIALCRLLRGFGVDI